VATWLDRAQSGLLGQPQGYGLLSDQELQAAQRSGMMDFGSSLLAASGPSTTPTRFGQAFGQAALAGRSGQGNAIQQALNAALLKKQMAAATAKQAPAGVQEYEFAKANGFPGTFEEWKRVGSAKPVAPSGIQEYEYFQKLSPEGKKEFMALQRSPVVPQLAIVNGVPTLVDRTAADPASAAKPLSSIESETAAVAARAEAEAKAKARGGIAGEAEGSLKKKAINAMTVMESLDLAEPLIDVSTGSATGAAADKVAAFFGTSLEGDQANAQLKILQANLMTNMPRMEGPQSDRDVQLYREAAGEIGEATVPRGRKRAALSMIRALQEKYAEGGDQQVKPAAAKSSDGWSIKKVK
jgi:hypothetical protein